MAQEALTSVVVGRLRCQVSGGRDWWRLAGCVVVVGTWRGASRSFPISAGFSCLTHHHFLDFTSQALYGQDSVVSDFLNRLKTIFFSNFNALSAVSGSHSFTTERTFRATVV